MLLFRSVKYVVYALLVFNIYGFFAEDIVASRIRFPQGVPFSALIEAFSATIDTAAWVVLLLMFELEVGVLRASHKIVNMKPMLHVVRGLCYAFIVYALYGYIANLAFVSHATVQAAVPDLCSLVAEGWHYVIDLDEYTALTAANCDTFSNATQFYRLSDMLAIVDADGLRDIRNLAWTDVINSVVWLLVVLALEFDVRLREKGRTGNIATHVNYAVKFALYLILLLAAIYWGLNGDFIDFWDAFLWLIAFVFIELDVFGWQLRNTNNRPAS